MLVTEEYMQELRSKATEFFLREQWNESLQAYSQLINLCQHQILDPDHVSKTQKSICLAFSNRAEARFRMRDFDGALKDCDEALKIESTHFKTLMCKGKILLALNKYSMALECFRAASLDPQASENSETLNGFLDKTKKLEYQSRAGAFDISDWVLNKFRGESPDLAEYVGPVQIGKSGLGGRGMFATKNIDAGTVLLVTKAVAIERGIVQAGELGESKQLVMWKNFINKVTDSASKCGRINHLISTLSSGANEEVLEVPDISVFRPEMDEISFSNDKLDMNKILSILDVNSLVEDAVSAKVLGKNRDYYGVGLWILASFINHSCCPNSRRLHMGNHLIVHASRDVKAGEEITIAYFDVLKPVDKRRELSAAWGFHCACKRCKFEEAMSLKQELKDLEVGIEVGMDTGCGVYRLEEVMRKGAVRGKEKGFLRASFWSAYAETYRSEKLLRRWERRIPTVEVAVDSVVDVGGSDERVLKIVVEQLKRRGGNGMLEMERVFKLGRGLYGKVVKKQALRTLLEI